MGLFSKKDPCAICGGKVSGLFPAKVEGQLICKECYGNVDLPDVFTRNMTMEMFREYRAFREENDLLKQKFQATQQISFGFFGEQFLLDTNNGLFCRDSNLNGTVFEGKCIQSFVIREDGVPLFEGSASGLICHTSTVPERVSAMTPMIQQIAFMKEMQRQAERRAKEEGQEPPHRSGYNQDLPEPFQKFYVEIYCDHPYWKTLTADKKGPTFNDSYPSVQDYLNEYQEDAQQMAQLARGLMAVAFPGAPELSAEAAAAAAAAPAPVAAPAASAAPAAAPDVVTELQRFKELLDQGILTEEEFTAKKRQLLGI